MKRIACSLLIGLAVSAGLAAAATAQTCITPQAPAFVFTPPVDVGAGESYAVSWTSTTTDADDYYVIERSRSSSFATILDSQQVAATSASFLVDAEGKYYHRVRAIPACDTTTPSANSATATVNVVAGAASVVFTVQPKPVISNLGESLTGKRTAMVLENVTSRPVTVLVTQRTLGDSPNFFRIVDEDGAAVLALTLEPRTPKMLDCDFGGLATSTSDRRSYQGVVLVVSEELAVIPYAYVNLKVGGNDSATPYFTYDGLPTEYVAFPGFSGEDDSGRAPLTVDVVNPGSSSQEVAAEIGPEVWLEPGDEWNASPIPARSSISVPLTTKRERALAGSPLPRYTYFTIHTKSGESARLLVQDNGTADVGTGRNRLDGSDRSLVVSGIITDVLDNGRPLYSIVSLANVGSADLVADLFFTPDATDGFFGSTKASVVVPANDVVRLTDPLSQIFGRSAPSTGQIEVRVESGAVGLMNVAARVFTPSNEGAGGYGYRLPVATRGEGARKGTPHAIPGVTAGADESTELTLAETTGVDRASVRVDVFDSLGPLLGSRTVTVPRYGQTRIEDVVKSITGATTIVAGRIELTVTAGEGSVVGTLLVRNDARQGWINVSQPSSGPVSKRAAIAARSRIRWPDHMLIDRIRSSGIAATPSIQLVIPNVVKGTSGSLPGNVTTTVGISSPLGGSTSVILTLVSSSGSQAGQKVVIVGAGQTLEYKDVVKDLFGLSLQFQGVILGDSSNLATLFYARQSTTGTVTTTLAMPIVLTTSESLTGAGQGEKRPIYIDGIEQSIVSDRGSTWSLLLNEVRNDAAAVEVRVYEAGNRVVPIAKKTLTLDPLGELRLEPLFAGLDLASSTRSKDRINLMVVVNPVNGSGLVSAVALGVDNRTGGVVSYRLTPTGGIPATGIALAAPIPLEPPQPPRRHGVRRP